MSVSPSANTATSGTQRRWATLPSAPPLAKIGMITFAIGLLAIVADLVLFVAGSRNLPLWLNLLCMLAPLGLGIGLFSVIREARSASKARTADATAAPDAVATPES